MTGVIAFRSYAIPDRASFAITIELLGWIRLHTAKTFCFFWFCSIEVAHHGPEFFIFIPCGKVNSAGTTI
jgi:hypothetical protein